MKTHPISHTGTSQQASAAVAGIAGSSHDIPDFDSVLAGTVFPSRN